VSEHETIEDAEVEEVTAEEPSTEVAVRTETVAAPGGAALNLFGTSDPVLVVEKASRIATALADVIDSRNLFTMISGKKHVRVEGWTVLGSMLGVFPVLQECVPVDIDGVKGFEATVIAQTLDGSIVGKATAYCMRNEGRWRNADTFAVSSMAQTRATSKSLRLPLGFIMALAGYEATPAEERDNETSAGSGAGTPGAPMEAAATPAEDPARKEAGLQAVRDGIAALAGKPGWSVEEILGQATLTWGRPIEKLDDLTVKELGDIYKGMKQYGGLE